MKHKISNFFETFIVVAILLVLIQTFMEDFAVLAHWDWNLRRILIFTGFGFDLLFTVEFLIRYFSALSRGEAGYYFLEGRGWIDFLASIPLLLLNSGPTVLSLMLGGSIVFGLGSMLNILKIVKAIRIARILRLLRILKLFRRIKHISSPMAQRHMTKTNTLTVSTVVFTLFIFTLIAGFSSLPSIGSGEQKQRAAGIEMFINGPSSAIPSQKALTLSRYEPDLLIIKHGNTTIYSRYSNAFYNKKFGAGDFSFFEENGWSFFFDNRDILQVQSLYNILFFLIVIMLVVMSLLYYGPHFALTVTDPIHVMERGFEEDSYNLEVAIPDKYKDDDVYRLGKQYNIKYLPLKQRSLPDGEKHTNLSFDDFKDLME